MDTIKQLIKDEPVLTGGVVSGGTGAVLTALSAFGAIDFTADQTTAVFGLVTAVVTIVSIVTRSKVTPV